MKKTATFNELFEKWLGKEALSGLPKDHQEYYKFINNLFLKPIFEDLPISEIPQSDKMHEIKALLAKTNIPKQGFKYSFKSYLKAICCGVFDLAEREKYYTSWVYCDNEIDYMRFLPKDRFDKIQKYKKKKTYK